MSPTDSYSFVLFCRITDTVPPPMQAKIHLFPGSNATASTRSPMGRVVMTWPLLESITARTLLLHPINSREFGASMARPVGVLHPVIGHFCFTVRACGSKLTTEGAS